MDSGSALAALAEQVLVAAVQPLGRERRLTDGKGFLNAIAAAHVSEASLARASDGSAFLAGFGICESLTSNLLC